MVIERHGDQARTFVWRNKGALTVTTVLETFLADPHAFPQCLLARCLPQREHDRQPCARRCRWTDARKRKVRKLAGPRNSRGKPLVRADPAVNYFTAIPHAPTDQELNEIRADLRRTCRGPKAWLTPP